MPTNQPILLIIDKLEGDYQMVTTAALLYCMQFQINFISRAYVVLPMNGQGIYTTWTCIASLLNLGHCLESF